jgi:hypothetical protein
VERIGNVEVSVLPPVKRDELAGAGAGLPLDDWLG